MQSYSPTRCGARSRAPARSDLLWSWSMLWTSRRPASTPRMGSRDCPIHFGWCCRCVLRVGWLNDDVRIRAAPEPGEAPTEAKKTLASASGEAWQHAKRPFAARRGPPRPVATVENRGFALAPMQNGCLKPAILRLLLLPPGFSGSSERSGNKKRTRRGRCMPLISLRKIGAGRWFSPTRSQPWQVEIRCG